MAEEDPPAAEAASAPASGDAAPEESAPNTTSTNGDHGDANNATQKPSAQPSHKKRRPDIQLNKDDHPEGHECASDDDDDLNDEGGKRSDPFKRASEEVLKKRKIVKASSKWGGGAGGNGAGKSGLFGSVKLAPATAGGGGEGEKAADSSTKSTSVFGSGAKLPTFGSALGGGTSTGFGSAAGTSSGFGFGNVSSGFGSLKPSTSDSDKAENGEAKKSSGFGGGGGSLGFGNAASSGFGSLKASGGFGFGSTATDSNSPAVTPGAAGSSSNGSGLAGTFASSTTSNKTSSSPTKVFTSAVVDTANGEQDEDCLCQVRAKLFKMVPRDDTPETGTEEDKKADVPSVAPTSRTLETLAKSSPEKSGQSPDKANESTSAEGGEEKPKLVQKEAGIGPVRVLKRKAPLNFGTKNEKEDDKSDEKKETSSARVVQRQETSGGQATRVILNVRLVPKTCTVIRRGDKFVQLNAPNSDGTLESSLFKVKTTAEADKLEGNLKAMLRE